MSNSPDFNDFYQVPDLKFDIQKFRSALEDVLKKFKVPNIRYNEFWSNSFKQNSWRRKFDKRT